MRGLPLGGATGAQGAEGYLCVHCSDGYTITKYGGACEVLPHLNGTGPWEPSDYAENKPLFWGSPRSATRANRLPPMAAPSAAQRPRPRSALGR
eukprot:2588661-Prymnesium_polylepis.1